MTRLFCEIRALEKIRLESRIQPHLNLTQHFRDSPSRHGTMLETNRIPRALHLLIFETIRQKRVLRDLAIAT